VTTPARGTATNLPARLFGEAAGGQILISHRVHGEARDLGDSEPIGELTLKGRQRPLAAFQVRGLKS